MEHSNIKLTRRSFLARSIAAISAAVLMSGMSFTAMAKPTTAEVNTTGLAVTDDTVRVGILHSITGTMAISEEGSQSGVNRIRNRPGPDHHQASLRNHGRRH